MKPLILYILFVSSVTSCSLGPNIFTTIALSNTLSLCSSLTYERPRIRSIAFEKYKFFKDRSSREVGTRHRVFTGVRKALPCYGTWGLTVYEWTERNIWKKH